MRIAYEAHPVSPERKAELIAAGLNIIDARFAPSGELTDSDQAKTVRRGRPRKSGGE